MKLKHKRFGKIPRQKIIAIFTWCLKITEKVAFNIASEASYVYILSGQKFIKNAKNGQFDEFLKTKIDGKCQN